MGSRDNEGGEARAQLLNVTPDEYRQMLDDLDTAWRSLTNDQRTDLEDEYKRRRSANPNWPYMTADHADSLIGAIQRSTFAANKLRDTVAGANGLAMHVRDNSRAVNELGKVVAENTAELREVRTTMTQVVTTMTQVVDALSRLAMALEPRPA